MNAVLVGSERGFAKSWVGMSLDQFSGCGSGACVIDFDDGFDSTQAFYNEITHRLALATRFAAFARLF